MSGLWKERTLQVQKVLELLCFLLFVIGLCDLALARIKEQDALAPPLSMASKEFHRSLRSEARNYGEDLELKSEIFLNDLMKLKLQTFTIRDIGTLIKRHATGLRFIDAIDASDPALIDEKTYRSLQKIKLRLIARLDQIETRYLELTDLNRSEARIRERSA